MIENEEFEIRRAEWLRQYKEDQMKKLDEQGRHCLLYTSDAADE